MSEEEEEEIEEEVEEEKKAPATQKVSISAISQQLDDLTFSLGVVFPSFGMYKGQSSLQRSDGRMTNNIKNDSYGSNPYGGYGRPLYGKGNNYENPKDIISKQTKKEYVGNELLPENKLRIATSPKSMNSQSFIGVTHGSMNRNQHSQPQKRDFGIQTNDSMYSHSGAGRSQNRQPQVQDYKRVDFLDKSYSYKEKSSNATPYDISSSNMKQFSRNVQDLYRRKPKAGN